jgi:hypothetical protein
VQHVLFSQPVDEKSAEFQIALGGSILQGGLAAFGNGHHFGENIRHFTVRQGFPVDEARRQGDDAWYFQGACHQPTDFRRGVAPREGREPFPPIER